MLQEETLREGLSRLVVPSPTLPPATTTNAWLLGKERKIVIDPAAKNDAGHRLLAQTLEKQSPSAIFLTHHHKDHIGSAPHLRDYFQIPILAHPQTEALVPFSIDQRISDQEILKTDTEDWRSYHTPGHAPGHLCLLSEKDQSLVAGDMVAGEGTILIHPTEGSIREYLQSLEKLKTLSPSQLLPAHGAALKNPQEVLTYYIEHRKSRLDQILSLLTDRPQTTLDIAKKIYLELAPAFLPIAAIQVECGLIWLEEEELAVRDAAHWTRR